jgi:hypothetical protein
MGARNRDRNGAAARCRLCKRPPDRYFPAMRLLMTASTWLACAIAASAAAAVTGLAFAGWSRHGAGIFLAMAENGLSWCF